MKRTVRICLLILVMFVTAFLLAACTPGSEAPDDPTEKGTGVTSGALALSEDGKTLVGVVAYDTEVFSFARDITVARRARISVYANEACTVKLSRKVSISFGDNLFYLRVTNGPNCTVYRVVIRRGEMATLSFDLSEGAADLSALPAQHETVGMKPSSLPQPTWAGHLFAGWYTDPDCTLPYAAEDVLAGDTTLYAGWKPGPGGTVDLKWLCDGAEYASSTVAYGEVPAFPADPASDDDRLFAGWLTADGALADPTAPVTDHMTFTASFITEKHTLTYLYEGEIVGTDTVFLGTAATEPDPPFTMDPVAFLGWYEAGVALPFDFAAGIDRDLTLEARFTSPDFTRTASFTVTLPMVEGTRELLDALLPGGAGRPLVNAARVLRRTVKGLGDIALGASFSVRLEKGGEYGFSFTAASEDETHSVTVADAITSDEAVVIAGTLHLGVALSDEGRETLTYAEMLKELIGYIDFDDPEAAGEQIRFIISLILSQIGGAGTGGAF